MANDTYGSRIRWEPESLFSLFAEVVIPTQSNEQPWVLRTFPHKFENKQILKMVAESAIPVSAENAPSICQGMVTHFSFVITALDSKWSFGFVRHTPHAPTCLVLVSDLPWHETFYRLLNHISDLMTKKEDYLVESFLENLHLAHVPQPGFQLVVNYNKGRDAWSCITCDHTSTPSIPENRNLTEYYNACDPTIMIQIFTAMLHERRIIIVSRRLNRLSSCVQAANLLIYPMQWQHLFIPVLPLNLIDTLNAPMPFLIGVPSSTWERVRQSELGEVVIYHADQNKFVNPFNDHLPSELEHLLKRKLKNPDAQLGDGFAQAFMHILVILIGDYRSGFRINQSGKVDFDKERFLLSQPTSLRPFLEGMLQLQILAEFVENRMRRVNEPILDRFEIEASIISKSPQKLRYKEWLQHKPASAVRSAYKQVKQTGNLVKDKSRKAYKEIQTKITQEKLTPVTRRSGSSTALPNSLQRMNTSPNMRLTTPPERPPLPERQVPIPPRRPTSPPPAVPIVVNDLICLDDSPKRDVVDSFIRRLDPLIKTPRAEDSRIHQSVSDNSLAMKRFSMDFDSLHGTRELIQKFGNDLHITNGLSGSSSNGTSNFGSSGSFGSSGNFELGGNTFENRESFGGITGNGGSNNGSSAGLNRSNMSNGVDRASENVGNFDTTGIFDNGGVFFTSNDEIVGNYGTNNKLPILQPPPRKVDFKRTTQPSRPPRANAIHLLEENRIPRPMSWQQSTGLDPFTLPVIRNTPQNFS